MYGLSKKQKFDFILEKIKELDLTAYEIGKKTGLNTSGIERILNGNVKNPQENTLDKILLFLENKVLGSEIGKINLIEEPKVIYERPEFDIKKYITCMETESKLRKEIARLHGILRKNKIEFDDDFE